jgi:hypothetical protein
MALRRQVNLPVGRLECLEECIVRPRGIGVVHFGHAPGGDAAGHFAVLASAYSIRHQGQDPFAEESGDVLRNVDSDAVFIGRAPRTGVGKARRCHG